jgi:hypothetical protein
VAKTLANLGKVKMVHLGDVGTAIECFGEAQMLARFTNNDALLKYLYDLMNTAVSQLEPASDDVFDDDTWKEKTTQRPNQSTSTTSSDSGWDLLLTLGGSGEKKTSEE